MFVDVDEDCACPLIQICMFHTCMTRISKINQNGCFRERESGSERVGVRELENCHEK